MAEVRRTRGAELLRAAMVARGETQADVFRALGTVSAVVSRWLGGTRFPGRQMAVQIERLYGVPVGAWDEEAADEKDTDKDPIPVAARLSSGALPPPPESSSNLPDDPPTTPDSLGRILTRGRDSDAA